MIRWLIGRAVENRLIVLFSLLVLTGAGLWALDRTAIDAIPDLSDVQVVLRTEVDGQAPQIVEDQVTYPLTTAMLSVPYAEVVRGYSMFGMSFVYVLFEDGTDPYWARSRVLEQLSVVSSRLPPGVTPELGPDATGVGWIYQYALLPGPYCRDYPQGLWHDPTTDLHYATPDAAPDDPALRARLVRRRTFPPPRHAWRDPATGQRHHAAADAPPDARPRLTPTLLAPGFTRCPVGDGPLVDPDLDLSDLRGLQDWFLRYELTSLEGVSEVASLGGFVKQYQVVVDPVKLRAYDLSLAHVNAAVRASNLDVGGGAVELAETERLVRSRGYLGTLSDAELRDAEARGQRLEPLRTARALDDLRAVSLATTPSGVPVTLADVADVRVGPEARRGVADWDGLGEVVGGIVVMRHEENARATIARVKARLAELEPSLPPGVAVVTAYDRSGLIDRAAATLTATLLEEMLVVTLVVLLFLLHARSALVAAFVLPSGVLASLLAMHLLDLNANIMALGGIALAIGVMVDSAIVMVENAHKHLELEHARVAAGAAPRPRAAVITDAAREVGPSLFFSLLIITVSFLPVFALGEQSGRLFKPLAYTKTFAMAAGALLAVTVIPVLMVAFLRERVLPAPRSRRAGLALLAALVLGPALLLALVPLGALAPHRAALALGWAVLSALVLVPQRLRPEQDHPLSRLLERLYDPAFAFAMRHRLGVLGAALALVLLTLFPLARLGSEFMPPLEEGDLLYMPTTDPGISVAKVRELLQQTDRLIRAFPEVEHVFGKAGRAETATDPAEPSMLETTITLKPDRDAWRQVPVDRFYAGWPDWLAALPRLVWPDTRPITLDELVYGYDLPGVGHVPGLDDAVRFPGLTNSWTMPIRTRIDMLSTGIKTPVGVKLMGPDLATLAALGQRVADLLGSTPGLAEHTASAFAERAAGGAYLDLDLDRAALARHGLSVAEVQDVVMSAVGGMNLSATVEGRERYPIHVRYPHELRDNLPALRATLVRTPAGAQVPLAELATFALRAGPPMVKSENARPTSWVYVDVTGLDVGTYVARAERAVAAAVPLPPGYTLVWSGQYEYMEEAHARLAIILPLTGAAIVLLLYLATRSWLRVGLVLLAVPFSLVGAVWLLYALDYDLSVAVWVGLIALAGLDAETGLVMLLYLDASYERFAREGRLRTPEDLRAAIHDGAVKRIRPKTMTVVTTFVGLLPLLWATGAGADTMRRLAVPMIGGLFTSFAMELLLYPLLFHAARSWQLRKVFQPG